MNILAVETSGLTGSIALADGSNTLEERSLAAEGRRNAQTLALEVDALLKRHELKPLDIDVMAVSFGPGSFTGLRVGVVFAKTFAWANKASLIAVDTFRAIAQQAGPTSQIVTVISDAQRQELFVNHYEWDTATQSRTATADVTIKSPETVSATALAENQLLTGPALDKFSEHFSDAHQIASADIWQPQASSIAHIAHIQHQQGEQSNIHTLEPLYIRRSYAEESGRPDRR